MAVDRVCCEQVIGSLGSAKTFNFSNSCATVWLSLWNALVSVMQIEASDWTSG